MKEQLLRTASVCALVVAVGGAAIAQTGGSGGGSSGGGSPGGGSAPQTEKRMPDGGSSGSGSGSTTRETPSRQGSPSGETVQPKGGSAQSPSTTRQPSAQRDDATPRKQDRSDTRDEQKRNPQASSGERKDDGKRASDRSDRAKDQDRTRTGEEQRGRDRDRARTGQDDQRDRGDRTRQGQAERERGKDSDARRADRGREGRTQISEQQRTTVRERFTRANIERNRVTNVNFDIRVGASVPRSVTLHTLPPDVVEVVPAYRGYSYVYVNDEIIIVDPSDYAVVAVISSSGRATAGGRSRTLTLAAPDRVFVREHIDRGASIRLGIGGVSVGMTIPQGVSLLPMPEVVVSRYPDLREYRYFVYEDDIAVVDPSTDEVVLILED